MECTELCLANAPRARFISRRDVVAGRQRYDLIAQGNEKRIRTNDDWSGSHLRYLGECGIKLGLARSAVDMKLQSESARCFLDILNLRFSREIRRIHGKCN